MRKHINIAEVKKACKIAELSTAEEKLVNGGNASMAVMYGIRIPIEVLIELGLIIARF